MRGKPSTATESSFPSDLVQRRLLCRAPEFEARRSLSQTCTSAHEPALSHKVRNTERRSPHASCTRFYNVSTRRKALKSKSEEFKRVLEVVSRYAIHFGSRGVSFTCKKHGQGLPALHTLKTNSTLQNIAAVYGSKLSQELVAFTAAEHWGDDGSAAADDSDEFSYKADGYISNANFNRANGIFLLFINDRLVSSAKLKRAFDNVYSEYLPRKRHAFVYLSIKLPSHHCDVNVHPTKNQVHFLHEEMLVQKLQNALSAKLKGANESRTFYTQVHSALILLPSIVPAAASLNCSTVLHSLPGSPAYGNRISRPRRPFERR